MSDTTSTTANRLVVPGSERIALPGARVVGAPSADERITVTLRLRSRSQNGLGSLQSMYSRLPAQREHLSREEYSAQHGAQPEDVAKVEQFLHEHNLDIVEVSIPRRTIRASGRIHDMQLAFGVELKTYQHGSGTYRGRVGAISLPAGIQPLVEGTFGLDNRPVASPHFRPRAAGGSSFTPTQLAALYNFPQGADGKGQTIGIIELGGGYRAKDLKHYFSSLNIPQPSIIAVSVDGGHSQPSTADSADGEVMLDIEVAGAVAPGANIVVYFSTNTDAGFIDAVTTAVHDSVHKPSVLSISWGSPEANYTDQTRTAFNQALQEAAALGVTVCVAAGDDGASDVRSPNPSPDNLPAHVDFPASSPFALACGGTRLTANGNSIGSETVWNELANNEGATGGGISNVFPTPDYQAGLTMPASINPGAGPGRGVPDVSGDADPTTGYQVLVDGQSMVIGGTSAVAPLWAGLIAVLNQELGHPIGFFNPLLYSKLGPNGALNDVTSGDNGGYQARSGWDACTGWGSPNGTKILQMLTASTTQAVVGGQQPAATSTTTTASSNAELLTAVEK